MNMQKLIADTETKTAAISKAAKSNKGYKASQLKAAKKASPVVRTLNGGTQIYTLLGNTPAGKKMHVYTEAAFHMLGAFTSGRKSFSASNMLAFYQTASIFRHHVKNGNIETTKSGYHLTATGLKFFKKRHNGATGITTAQVKDCLQMFKTGKTAGTVFAGMTTSKQKISL